MATEKFIGMWGFTTIVVQDSDGLYQAHVDADEYGAVMSDLKKTSKEAIAEALRKTAEVFEKD